LLNSRSMNLFPLIFETGKLVSNTQKLKLNQ
jgi:hypothetical protein